MTQKFVWLFLLIPFLLISQNAVVKGKLTNKEQRHNSLIIYQLKGSKQKFITYGQLAEDGSFSVDVPDDCNAGTYRLVFGYGNRGFIDFIFNHSDVELHFDSKNPFESASFKNSEENNLYYSFIRESEVLSKHIDSIELAYVQNMKQLTSKATSYKKQKRTVEKDRSNYKKALKKYQEFNAQKIEEAQGMLVENYLKAMQIFYTSEPSKNVEEQASNLKKYYFHYVDFNDEYLINSQIIFKKTMDFVLDDGKNIDKFLEQEPYTANIDYVLSMIVNKELKNELTTQMMYVFTELENRKVFEHLLNNYYLKLPKSEQDQQFVKRLESKLSVAVGELAPNFSWTEKGIAKELNSFNKAEEYILVFWSTGCSHCRRQIPKLYELTKDRNDVHVIGYAIEDTKEAYETYEKRLPNWTNILGLKKWENPVAVKYQIDATPTYFILNADKKIIDKPYSLKELKNFLEKKNKKQ